MPFEMIQIGEPYDIAHANKFITILCLLSAGRLYAVIWIYLKPFCAAIIYAQPDFFIFDKGKNFFVSDSVLLTKN